MFLLLEPFLTRPYPFRSSPARYYNCVPFAGCVFVAPSKMCQPRVKTFEELPLELHQQKSQQVRGFSFQVLNIQVAFAPSEED